MLTFVLRTLVFLSGALFLAPSFGLMAADSEKDLAVSERSSSVLLAKADSDDDDEDTGKTETPKGNQVVFIGMDISGSFKNSPYYEDSIKFISHYIYARVHGLGGLKTMGSLFIGSIGGAKVNEPKTFYPIQTFQYKSIPEIEKQLHEIFPVNVTNKFTDFNAFFEQVATFMKNKKLLMKTTDVIMLTDGIPDAPTPQGRTNFQMLDLKPFENLSRKITVRVLYTSAQTGANWQSQVPRRRVRVWTQDATVMSGWKAPDLFLKDTPIEKQERWFKWVLDNVDFPVKPKRVTN